MSLYQKVRPTSFAEVAGNDDVVKSLVALTSQESPPHALLLTGPSGCGKTTLGRIVARSLGASDDDYREVDSADFRGIDTIREIRRGSEYMALHGQRRCWLLDECFSRDTRVATPVGEVPIQDIRPGDCVYSLAGPSRIRHTFRNIVPIGRIVRLGLSNGRSVFTTVDHLFCLWRGQWRKAGSLSVGDLLFVCQGEGREEGSETVGVRVDSIEIYQPGRRNENFQGVVGNRERDCGFAIFYDLEVETDPSYFAEGVAVHNCHRLPGLSQDALLKGLEDPPSHAYFVLCTTAPESLSETIKSRCSIHRVSPLSEQHMVALLHKVSSGEGVRLTRQQLRAIHEKTDGKPRAAIQLLETVLAADPDDRDAIVAAAESTKTRSDSLAREMMRRTGWKAVAAILADVEDDDVETVRRGVLGYVTKVLLGGENDDAARILDQFIDPFFQSGKSGLIHAAYCVVKGE